MCDAVGRSIAGRAPGAHLNAEGLAQAEALAARLAGAGVGSIYSSPQERAMVTARPLGRRLGLPVVPREALAEIDFGVWTGKTLAELEGSAEWRRFNEQRSTGVIPGGERMADVQARVVRELTVLARMHAGERLVVMSHGDVIRAALLHYLGRSLDEVHSLEIPPASVTLLTFDDVARIVSIGRV